MSTDHENSRSPAASERDRRRAEALRANLARRKIQARDRQTSAGPEAKQDDTAEPGTG